MKSKVPPIPKHAEVKADPGVLARFNSSVIEEFRANGGVVGGPFENSAVMLLTMTGAKSGQPRLTPLEYFQVDGRVIFVGTRGGGETNPAWVHNVRANPNVHVEMGAESYDAVARELSGDERDSVYAKGQRALSPDSHVPRAGAADSGLRAAQSLLARAAAREAFAVSELASFAA